MVFFQDSRCLTNEVIDNDLQLIVGSTVGYLLPAMNGFCLQLELLMAAWKYNCINKDRMEQT